MGKTACPSSLGVFFRTPEYGRVKTRIAAEIGDGMALQLYRLMLAETFEKTDSLKNAEVYYFYEGSVPVIGSSDRRTYMPQAGADLGEKMRNAFRTLLNSGYCRICLIGADSPDLPVSYIDEAFRRLDMCDIVIGPARDGGYYLIGMKQMYERLFDNISWGTDRVFEETLSAIREYYAGSGYSLLPEWYDIDTIDDATLYWSRTSLRCHKFFRAFYDII